MRERYGIKVRPQTSADVCVTEIKHVKLSGKKALVNAPYELLFVMSFKHIQANQEPNLLALSHSVTEIWGFINIIVHISIIIWMIKMCVSAAGHHLSGLRVRHLLPMLHLVSDVQGDEEKGHSSASCGCQEHVISLVTTKLLKEKKKKTLFGLIYFTKTVTKML